MHWAELTVSLTKTLLPTTSVLVSLPPNLTFLYDSRQIFLVHFCINFNTLYRSFTQFKKKYHVSLQSEPASLAPEGILIAVELGRFYPRASSYPTSIKLKNPPLF